MMYYFGLIMLFFSFISFISSVKAALKKDHDVIRTEEMLCVLWLIAALICLK